MSGKWGCISYIVALCLCIQKQTFDEKMNLPSWLIWILTAAFLGRCSLCLRHLNTYLAAPAKVSNVCMRTYVIILRGIAVEI